MRRAPREAPQRVAQAMRGYAEEMEHAGVASELRHHRRTVHGRGHRHQCRDAPVVGGNPNDMTAGIGDPPQHYAFGIDPRQPPGGGDGRVIVLALA